MKKAIAVAMMSFVYEADIGVELFILLSAFQKGAHGLCATLSICSIITFCDTA
jgi:hypothetical protein